MSVLEPTGCRPDPTHIQVLGEEKEEENQFLMFINLSTFVDNLGLLIYLHQFVYCYLLI